MAEELSLAEIRAKREAIALRQAERAKSSETAREMAALEDDEACESAIAKYGEQGVGWDGVRGPDGRLTLLRRADGADFRRFSEDPKSSHDLTLAFIAKHVIYPAVGVFHERLDTFPGLLVPLSETMARMAGLAAVQLGKAR
jgi:hypothetical protein